MTTFGLALLASLAGCALWALVPIPREPFAQHLARRGTRMAGRTVTVLAVIVIGLWYGGYGPAVIGGAFLGWFFPTFYEWKQLQPRNGEVS